MARFKFRLATLRKIRETIRDDRRARLAEAYRADEILEEQADEIGRNLGMLYEECRRVSSPGEVDVDRLTQAHLHELVLRGQQHQLRLQRERVAVETEARREALVQANREVRILEKLEEKQRDRYRREESRRETRLLDEVAQQHAARGSDP
jgi:flagellar FliJ protein